MSNFHLGWSGPLTLCLQRSQFGARPLKHLGVFGVDEEGIRRAAIIYLFGLW